MTRRPPRSTRTATPLPNTTLFRSMRADVARDIDLYGELHRDIPVLAAWAGYRTGEVDVTHHARAEGQSKFGAERFWRGLLDLVTVKFLTTYNARPFHLFGGIAALTGAVGGALLTWMLVLRISGERVGDRPALLAGVLLVVVRSAVHTSEIQSLMRISY